MAIVNFGTTNDLAKSDTANAKFNWLMVVTSPGAVVYNQKGGNEITLASVPVGVWIPVGKALNVKVASTAVGFMVM